MAKKKEIKQIFENLDLESSDVHPKKMESAEEDTNQEAPVQGTNAEQAGDEEAILRAEMLAAEQTGEEAVVDQAEVQEETVSPEISPIEEPKPEHQGPEEENLDDILDDVRKSLLEESQEQEDQPKWWRRIGRSSNKKKVEEEPVTAPEEINLPPLNAIPAVEAESPAGQEVEADEYQDQIDELIDLLEKEEETAEGNVPSVTKDLPVAEEPEKPVDIEELKKQAFQSRPTEQPVEENLTEVRSIALEGEEEVFVEVESRKPDQLEERISAVENALKPYQRYINFSLAFLGLVMAVIAAFLIYNAYQRSVAQEAPTEVVSNLPFPTEVGLPGGWNFTLGKGSLTAEGTWNPTGAEWLQGTEVCRWVALPYSRQLEAVIRTLNPDDPIELGMSNNDRLVYSVYSINQMSPEEMRELDTNSPCLLIVLAEPDADKRWVLTALP